MHKTILVLVETVDTYLPLLTNAGYHLILAQTPDLRAQAIEQNGPRIDAVLTRGPLGLTAQEIDALPNLQIICVIGAGYEQVDLQAAHARHITVTNGAGANADAVADHAMAMLLALLRNIPQADASTRRGQWQRVISPSVTGKRLGILGMGAVGRAIAKRAHPGFDMPISYYNRTPRPALPYTGYDSVLALAGAVDILVVATPGGADTRHLVDAQVLHALGPQGYLVNIARASVVDTQALTQALQGGQLAGAALDVFDEEPDVPDTLKSLPNTVLTPHVAGQSPEAAEATVTLVLRNLDAFFAGKPVLTPVLH
ncbi:2-hydroxyacid dehydrogenase [Pseudomonas parafulva]|uniref:2-hydroxyacid dehydrogenase n=1 Tax=Pseudomonas parafulva TaxID=157782 RepID=UPI000734E17E|nr:2-hydroxyacid dehydrogenase [Pseudomonas parafulva]KTS92599.1 2-hydroxyacid dehydrogenase [Pseudomonas parafulva]